MSSTTETKKEGCCGGGKHHGPPSEERRQQREAEFKEEFLDEYRKQHGDALISAEQTWELYKAVEERWHAKMKERRHERHSPPPHGDGSSPHRHSSPHHGHGPPPHRRSPSPKHFEEKRKRILEELQQDFQKDFETAHTATGKVNAEQAWSLIQKVQRGKHEKWEANRPKHGPGGHGRHSPPHDH